LHGMPCKAAMMAAAIAKRGIIHNCKNTPRIHCHLQADVACLQSHTLPATNCSFFCGRCHPHEDQTCHLSDLQGLPMRPCVLNRMVISKSAAMLKHRFCSFAYACAAMLVAVGNWRR
jgi:hypothetical protein